MRTHDPAAVDVAITSISRRRVACGDDCELLSSEPVAALRYVLSHPGRLATRGDDAGDSLVIVRELHAEIERIERALIMRARASGKTWKQVAGYLGCESAQGAQQRAQRIGAAEVGAPRSRPEAAPATQPSHAPPWLERNAEAVLRTARTVLWTSIPVPAVRDELDDLHTVVSDKPVRLHAVMNHLRAVVNGLTEVNELGYLGRALRDEALLLAAEWGREQDAG